MKKKLSKLFYSRILKLYGHKTTADTDELKDETVKRAKEDREAAEQKISNMIAQINGCGDRWFLKPVETLDECTPKFDEGKSADVHRE